jgi:ubiquinone/menaquinone biosynthesis C-methylase UbiE
VNVGSYALCVIRRPTQGNNVHADLSLRMIEFAKRHSPFQDIEFLHQDAKDLADIESDSYHLVASWAFCEQQVLTRESCIENHTLWAATRLS